jgi:putative phage-type endonuclease
VLTIKEGSPLRTRIFAELDLHEYPDYGLPRDEWLGKRRLGVGSADVAKLYGLDRYGSEMSLYLDKLGELEAEPENEMMRWGRRLESAVASEFQDETGLYPWRPNAMYQHAEIDIALASPDRLVMERAPAFDGRPEDDALGVLEIKTGRNEAIWDDGPPEAYVLQVVHQMEVTGLEDADISVLLNGRDYRSFHVKRDPILAEMVMDRELEFWQRVVDRNPPPADEHPATTEALKRMYASTTPDKVVDLTDVRDAIESFRETRDRLKVIEAAHDLAGNTLRAYLKDAEIGLLDGEKAVTYKTAGANSKGRVNIARLEHDHPEIVAEYREPGTYRVLRVK